MTWLKNNWLTLVVLILVVVAGIYIYKEIKEAKDAKDAQMPVNTGIISQEVADAINSGILDGAM